MVIGTFYFNGVIRWPFAQDEENAAERAPLLESSRDEDESGRWTLFFSGRGQQLQNK